VNKLRTILLVCLVSVLAVGAVVNAEIKGYPVDIPGTNVNFFLYRYTGDEVPYDAIGQIWKNLSDVLVQWSSEGADPSALSPADVEVKTVGDVVGVYLKGQLIVEVDEFHATANHATRVQLATMWAENLKKGVEVFVELNQPR
jgi:hypothetical protein